MLICHKLSYRNGDLSLLKDVDLKFEAKERVFIVGQNGMGKSTLLKLLVGQLQPDAGRVEINKGWSLAYLPQDLQFDYQGSVFSIVAGGLGEHSKLIAAYHEASISEPIDLAHLAKLQENLDHLQAWDIQYRIETAISKLQLPADADFQSLSGGMKRRVLLARAIVAEPDVLLLDEPTNHLDIASIDWLAQYLQQFSGCLIVVTHDRAFMDQLSSRIIEIDRAKIYNYPGNYSNFTKLKEQELLAEQTAEAHFNKKLAQEEQWIRQGVKARRTRNEGRVRALKQLRLEKSQRRAQIQSASFTLNQSSQCSGEQVIVCEKLCFDYAGKTIVKDLDLIIQRGEKIGLIGPNGCGKTTLLKLLLGELSPSSGTVKLGTNLSLAYFDQLRAEIRLELSVRDNLAQGSDQITVNGKSKHVVSYLNDFLFSSKQVNMPAAHLSGGQFNRLLLAKLFTQAANLLILDEPSNDLDMDSLELLEALLVDFKGSLLLVSHDRQFLNGVISSSLAFLGQGRVVEYVGGYEDYLRQSALDLEPAPPKTASPVKAEPKERERPRLSYTEQKELGALPGKIENLERQIAAIHQQMAEPSYYAQPAEALQTKQLALAGLEAELTQAYQRWEQLEP